MKGKYTTVLVSLFGGLLGGALPRVFITAEPTVLAQDLQKDLGKYREIPTQAARVLRAERIELINKQGKPLAVLEVRYSEAQPAGSPLLTFIDKDEVSHEERKVSLTTARLYMSSGDQKWASLSPGGGVMFKDVTGGGGFGMVPPRSQPGMYIFAPTGMTTLDSQRLNIANKDGLPVATLP